jgi:hypothetical protein
MTTFPVSASSTTNPFEAALGRVIERLQLVVVPKAYRVFPSPDDHLSVRDHVRDVVAILDDWLSEIGDELADNAVSTVDLSCFKDAFLGAVDGNATFAFEQEADALIDGRRAA